MGLDEPLRIAPVPGSAATRLGVRAQPGARRSALLGTWNGHLKLALRSPPEGGRANEELLRLVAELLGLRPAQVELARGARGRLKELIVQAPPERVRERLLGLLGRER